MKQLQIIDSHDNNALWIGPTATRALIIHIFEEINKKTTKKYAFVYSLRLDGILYTGRARAQSLNSMTA